ncbi:MAG: hypothetical protein HYS81_04605 [Candidatus Aenigmatarchaeota archaeon]|nr:MAG: hypothetical protein HYS81_04605 [Candidatus Aenigmarchaeota archaeon]
MRGTTIWILFAALVLLATAVPASAHSPTTVAITEDGFSPDHVTVHVGDSVTWITRGVAGHWPASDMHPTHTAYPGSSINKCITDEKKDILDSCVGLKGGESYTFTFSQAGKWGLHDHLYPGNTMTVEVVGEEKVDVFKNLIDAVTAYLSSIGKSGPTSDEFRALDYTVQKSTFKTMAARDPAGAWKFLTGTFIIDGQVKENPHELAHVAGKALYKAKGIDGIGVCDPAFAFGCYHGVTEQMLLERGSEGVPEIESTCMRLFPNEEALIASCIHGTGHGLLTWESLDVGSALKDCDALGERHRSYCYDGVFMENSFSAPARDDWTLCESVDERYDAECAKYHVYGMGARVGWDPSAMAASCEEAPRQALRDGCFTGLGFYSANAARGDFNGITNACGTAQSEDGKSTCITSAAVEVIFQEYAGWPATSVNLCGSLAEGLKNECLARTTAIVADYKRGVTNTPEIDRIKSMTNLEEQGKIYLQLIERVGPVEAQEQLFHSGLPFTGQTHLLNHVVGEYLYEKHGAQGLVYCKEYFLASCYHGFVIDAIGFKGIDGMDEIMAECNKYGLSVSAQCSHAMGHGFLAWNGYANIPDALKMCNEMTSRVEGFPSFNCRDGVFMENIWGIHAGAPSDERWVKEGDNFYPCDDPRLSYADLDGCWANQPSLIYQSNGGDIAAVGQECLKVENPAYQKICFNALARQIHPLTKGDPAAAFSMCGLLPSEWTDHCLSTIATSDFSVGGRAMSFDICSNVKDKPQCYTGLFGAMSVYARTPQEYESFCAYVTEDSWKQACLNRTATVTTVALAK